MIEKLPKITNESSANDSKGKGEKALSKIRRILSGELPPVDTMDTERDEVPLPEIDSSTEVEKKDEVKQEKSLPQKGRTWHNDYDCY